MTRTRWRFSLAVLLDLSRVCAAPAARTDWGHLPLVFESNQGQADPQVKFLARAAGYTLFLTEREAVIAPTNAPPVRMRLVGANKPTCIEGLDPTGGISNYFLGNNPSKWRTNIPNYRRVRMQSVYRGVDVVYYGNPQKLEYDLVLAPGADASLIQMEYDGVESLRVDGAGDLVLKVAGGELRQKRPLAYQGDVQVAVRYRVKNGSRVGFELARYDTARPLTLDPELIYSTYLGGSGSDMGYGIAVDGAGNAYVTGQTNSTDFPTANPLQANHSVGLVVFITKINAAGSALVYSTYLGDNGTGFGIAVDAAGNAYVTGVTGSTDFPTVNPLQTSYGGGEFDVFVTKINAAGSALVYSTYLGGSGSDSGSKIAVDAVGNAYVTGNTDSTDFPTANPIQPKNNGGLDAFVTKINPTGSAMIYSTYLGGSGDENGDGIAVDHAGNAYVTGDTLSTDFPTANPFQSINNGFRNPFVTKINAAGSALVYSTYLGGSGGDFGGGIAVDTSGNAYVTGRTGSFDFPTTNPLQPTYGGNPWDVFVTKISADGSAKIYSTFLGGKAADGGYGIALDPSGNVYVTGFTESANFPITDPKSIYNGGRDAFVAKIDSTGSNKIYSIYLGGGAQDFGTGIAVDKAGVAYVTGYTQSTNFPTVNPLQANKGDSGAGFDIFVAAISNSAGSGIPVISTNGIVNNASFSQGTQPLSSGTIAAIFGSNLTDGTSCLQPNCFPTFSNGSLNTKLSGAEVTVDGKPAPILYASPSQVGIEIPTELTGSSASVQVTVGGQTSAPQMISLAPAAPGIFFTQSGGKNLGAINHADGSAVTQENPAQPSELVVLYATGLGQVQTAVPTGNLPSGADPVAAVVTVGFDGVPVTPEFAGLSGCCVGENQVNVRIPSTTRSGDDIAVVLTVAGKQSNAVMTSVRTK